MQYRKLGSSELEVSVLAFGAWQLADDAYWGASEQADAEAAVHAALDGGINLFDTAEMYGAGESERMLGRALGTERKNVVVASKIIPDHCTSRQQTRAHCEQSLQLLGTDYLDLYQIHWPPDSTSYEDIHGWLEELQDEGKIRYIGVSNFGPKQLADWIAAGGSVSNQVCYNLLFRTIEFDIVPACQQYGMGIMAYMPLMQGLLAGQYRSIEDIPVMRRRTRHFSSTREQTRHGEQGAEERTLQAIEDIRAVSEEIGEPMAALSLAWTLAQPGVATAIVGARKPEQLRRNLAAADLPLAPETIERLNAITEPLKQRLGPNADPWVGADASRVR